MDRRGGAPCARARAERAGSRARLRSSDHRHRRCSRETADPWSWCSLGLLAAYDGGQLRDPRLPGFAFAEVRDHRGRRVHRPRDGRRASAPRPRRHRVRHWHDRSPNCGSRAGSPRGGRAGATPRDGSDRGAHRSRRARRTGARGAGPSRAACTGGHGSCGHRCSSVGRSWPDGGPRTRRARGAAGQSGDGVERR